jgi:DUF4097 and DUF4098 domain-containing protein YvlB
MKLRELVRTLSAVALPPFLVVLGMAMLALMAAPATAGADNEKYVENFERTEKLEMDGKVYLSNLSGDINVKTWDRSEVKIEARKIAKAGTLEKAKEMAAEVNIKIEREDGRLRIETKYPEGRTYKKSINVSVEYSLTIPAKANVSAVTVSGNIGGENIGGLAKLTTVSGDIRVNKAHKGGEFTAVSGDIELTDITGDVEAKGVSGDITLDQVAGTVSAGTVSGNVDVQDLSDAEFVDINAHSGYIKFAGTLHQEGRYSLQTHSGPISVSVPKSSAFDFTCKTFSGTITSEFKVAVELEGELHETKQHLRGEVNGGGADLTVQTFSGDITLKKAD